MDGLLPAPLDYPERVGQPTFACLTAWGIWVLSIVLHATGGVQGNECEAESNGNHQSYAVSVNGIPIKGYGL